MYYDLLGLTASADNATIKTAYFDRYKEADAAGKQMLNKAKTCLLDDESRAAYNQALTKFGINDGAGKSPGLSE